MYTIATLDQFRRHISLDTSTDDTRLLAALQAASAQLERAAGRRFCPYRATLTHQTRPRRRYNLLLHDDLLELESVTGWDSADLRLLPPSGPASAIELLNGQRFDETVEVSGVWGWHDRWHEAWCSSTEVTPVLDADTATITVTDPTGADACGDSPRFQVGHLLRIEDEYLRVLAVGANSLSVLRGVNGTTASAHNAGLPIDTYQPAPDALALCLRWAWWLYREADNPAQQPPLLNILNGLRRAGGQL